MNYKSFLHILLGTRSGLSRCKYHHWSIHQDTLLKKCFAFFIYQPAVACLKLVLLVGATRNYVKKIGLRKD